MASIELNATNFSDTIKDNDFVIVDFWAPWCGPCRSFAPIYEELSEEYPDIVFAKVNTEEQQELAAHFQIRSIPTLMLFREQVILYSEAGALPKQGMQQLISDAKAVDMQEVHKSLQEQDSQASS
ncbi:MAG: thioredoxin [Gammaproteobacteria bacterium]